MSSSRPSCKPTEILSTFATGDIWGTCISGSRQSDLVVLDRDAFAALVSPCLDDQPAASGLHPLAEPVRLASTPSVRLKSPLHGEISPSRT